MSRLLHRLNSASSVDLLAHLTVSPLASRFFTIIIIIIIIIVNGDLQRACYSSTISALQQPMLMKADKSQQILKAAWHSGARWMFLAVFVCLFVSSFVNTITSED